MPEETDERKGLMLLGDFGRKSFAFCHLVRLNLNTKTIESAAKAGAPEQSYFNNLDPDKSFHQNQSRLVDTKQRVNREKRDFYNEDADDVFEQLFDGNLEQVIDHISNRDLSGLKNNFLEILRSNFAQPELKIHEIPITETRESEEKESRSERDYSPEDSGTKTVEISPLIDAINGTKIETLTSDQSIYVQLSDKYSNLYGSEGEDGEPPVLEADFLDFEARSEDSEEGLIFVHIQEGVIGQGQIPRGTLIKTTDYDQVTQSENESYERSLLTLMIISASLLILVIVFMFIFLDLGGL